MGAKATVDMGWPSGARLTISCLNVTVRLQYTLMSQWITPLSLVFMPFISLDHSVIPVQMTVICPSRLSPPEASLLGLDVAQVSHLPHWGVLTLYMPVPIWVWCSGRSGLYASHFCTLSPSHGTWHISGSSETADEGLARWMDGRTTGWNSSKKQMATVDIG